MPLGGPGLRGLTDRLPLSLCTLACDSWPSRPEYAGHSWRKGAGQDPTSRDGITVARYHDVVTTHAPTSGLRQRTPVDEHGRKGLSGKGISSADPTPADNREYIDADLNPPSVGSSPTGGAVNRLVTKGLRSLNRLNPAEKYRGVVPRLLQMQQIDIDSCFIG
jgi:hypothetical protein